MKKIVVGVLLFIIIAGVGIPFVNGLLMENVVKRSIGNLNTMYSDTGADVSVEIMRYDRNIFSTEIEWRMKLGSLKTVYGIDEIIFVDRADHGFTGIVSTTSLEKNKWFTDFVNNKLGGKNPLAITTAYDLSGQFISTITLDALTLPMEDEVMEVKAGKVVFECDGQLKNFSSDASWEGFSVPEKIQVDGLSMSSRLEKISTYIWDGTLSFGINKTKIKEKHEQVELINFKGDYSLDVVQEENTLSVVSTFGADQLVAGPEKINDAFVRIGVVNIDIPGFEEFMKLYTETINKVFKDIGSAENDPEKMKAILQDQMVRTQFKMISACEHLLKKGLEVQLSDLYAKLPEGEIKGDIVLGLSKDMTFAQFLPLLNQTGLITEIFYLQSDVSLPATLVGDNPMLLSPIYSGMQTGLFVKDGENLVHKAETKDAKLYLNGQEVLFQ